MSRQNWFLLVTLYKLRMLPYPPSKGKGKCSLGRQEQSACCRDQPPVSINIVKTAVKL